MTFYFMKEVIFSQMRYYVKFGEYEAVYSLVLSLTSTEMSMGLREALN